MAWGAAQFPSRWNRKGQRSVYTSISRSLAMAEVLVHLPRASEGFPGYSLLTITVQPTDLVLRRTLEGGRQWFERFGHALSEHRKILSD